MVRIKLICCLVVALVLGTGVPVGAADATASDLLEAQGHEVVATGLANPRGLHADGDTIYVAESGAGGPELVEIAFPGGAAFVCFGQTGGVTRIDAAGQSRIAVLPSVSDAFPTPDGPTCAGTGIGAFGPSDLVTVGETLWVTMGNGGDASMRDQVHPSLGRIVKVLPNGGHLEFADVALYEELHNPDGTIIDSNPNGITRHNGRVYVADAAANAVFEIHGQNVTTLSVLHPFDPEPWERPSCLPPLPGLPPDGFPIPPESVPTQVAVGPDGYLYVTTLPGFPFTPGSAKIMRIDRTTGEATVFAEGFSALTGMDVGPDGALYVAELIDGHLMEVTACGNFIPGRVMRVTEDSTEVIGHAPVASGVAVGPDGSVYVAVNTILPAGGEVWRFPND